MKYVLGIIFATFVLVSCYTDKKATKQIEKAISKKPELALEKFRTKYPCIQTGSDTTIVIKDTTIEVEVECPDLVDTTFIRDTIKTVDNKVVIKKVPVKVQLPGQVITKYVEDSAKIKLLSLEINKLQAENKDLKERVDGLRKWRKYLLIPYILILLALLIREGIKKWTK
jgi:hypothetical protein